jgi:hypothetical protein
MAKRKKVRPGEAFAFRNGQTAETIAELIAQLKTMDPADFNHHVNDQKNDIYTWLRDCLDPGLAEKIKNVRDQDKMIKMLQ